MRSYGHDITNCLISLFFAYFDERMGRPCFCLIKGLTDGLAINKVKLTGKKIIIGFFG